MVDRFGNAVANTYTLNLSYGVGLIAEGTGVLLNNELDDFAAAPGVPNAFGLVGYEANEPGPNKRPLSSMTPTIVLRNGKPFIVTGSPGGSRIITAVLQVLLNVIDYRMTIARGGAGAAHPSSMAAGRNDGRGRRAAGDGQGAGGARPQREGLAAVHLGAFDRGDAARPGRRGRHAHPRRAGGGALSIRTAAASTPQSSGSFRQNAAPKTLSGSFRQEPRSFVMAGLDPAIHALLRRVRSAKMRHGVRAAVLRGRDCFVALRARSQ